MLLSAAGAGSMVSLFIPLIVFFLLMYFMIMRPQKKEQQRVKSMLASMEVGDSIVTTSGFYGILIAFISLFEVIGPNMVGPSSSHTAGAASMALLARKLFPGEIKSVHFTLYGSFARTYQGHGTDRALLGGIMGFETDDLRIRDSLRLAKEQGIDYSFSISEQEDTAIHPNTADMEIEGTMGEKLFVRGVSIGGGKVKIVKLNQIEVDFTGEYSTLIVSQTDKPGVVAHITRVLSEEGVNIAFMRLFREEKGAAAFTVVESDEKIPAGVLERIRENPLVSDITLVQL